MINLVTATTFYVAAAVPNMLWDSQTRNLQTLPQVPTLQSEGEDVGSRSGLSKDGADTVQFYIMKPTGIDNIVLLIQLQKESDYHS